MNRLTHIIPSIIVLFPIFTIGYVLTYDMSWGPLYVIPNMNSNNWLLLNLFNITARIIPSWLIQKVLLLFVFIIASIGICKLVSLVDRIKKINFSYIPLVAALLYVFNPFFYTRLMAGQWLVLLGYALLPWAVAAIWKFLQEPRWRSAWPVAAWTAAIGLSSIHTIGIVAVAAIGLAIASGRANLLPKAKWAGVIVGLWVLANAIWLVPLATGQSQTAENISGFSMSQMRAFATEDTVAGSVPLSAALLTGFWADDQNRYILPSALPIWWIGVAILAVLVIAGAVAVIRRRDRLGMALMGLGFVAWMLGMGIAWGGSAWLTNGLVTVFPLYNGYREPHKWLMLLALAYCYLAAVGLSTLHARFQRLGMPRANYALLALVFASPFLFAPSLAWGAAGQLRSADYPTGWYAARDYLDANAESDNPDDTKILVLPWHLYLPISFAGRVVANPAPYFFEQDVITGNNFELPGVPDQNPTPLTTYVGSRLVPLNSEHQNTGTALAEYEVDYVLLLNESDYREYDWLNGQSSLQPVVKNESLTLYKVIKK